MPFTLDSIVDLEALMQRRARAAELASAQYVGCRQTLAYGPDPDHTLDLYRATSGQGLTPVLMFIHGGFWRSMRASQFSFLAHGFVDYGISLAVIDYPLMPRARMQEVVDACRRAALYLQQHAPALGLDRRAMAVAGNSAGGHLVAELMDRTWMHACAADQAGFCGGIAISGLFDLAPVSRSFQNDTLQLTDEEVKRFSPLCRGLDLGAPLLVAVGGDETGEFLRQSAEFVAHARAHGVPVEHQVVARANHITVVLDELAVSDRPLNRATRALLGLV
ncbi:MAG: alpha/beta hydrolase [Betaproteobacteria bacterium]|nr:alpha/beta hydrolase [Betaproteobacteria bacterium]